MNILVAMNIKVTVAFFLLLSIDYAVIQSNVCKSFRKIETFPGAAWPISVCFVALLFIYISIFRSFKLHFI